MMDSKRALEAAKAVARSGNDKIPAGRDVMRVTVNGRSEV
jgi:hypothetical protein